MLRSFAISISAASPALSATILKVLVVLAWVGNGNDISFDGKLWPRDFIFRCATCFRNTLHMWPLSVVAVCTRTHRGQCRCGDITVVLLLVILLAFALYVRTGDTRKQGNFEEVWKVRANPPVHHLEQVVREAPCTAWFRDLDRSKNPVLFARKVIRPLKFPLFQNVSVLSFCNLNLTD